MLNFLLGLFGKGKPSIQELLKNGAIVVDVRTSGEYRSGHVKGSKNIPLQSLSGKVKKLKKKNKVIITCCASGMRS
ncbi:MAG: rhodanese-like domain-containing protein, partial [Candidatus Poseidoniaceae archaeon]